MITTFPLSLFARPRLVAGLLGTSSAMCLAVAFWFQYAEGLQPCPLCIYQRWAHGVSLAWAMASFFFMSPRFAVALLAGLAVTFLAGTAVAVWHVMVEWHWVPSPGCSAPALQATTVEELESMLLATEVVRCDEIPWSFAGISMAGWNAIISLVLAGKATVGCLAVKRTPV